jgi:hypothetical protein
VKYMAQHLVGKMRTQPARQSWLDYGSPQGNALETCKTVKNRAQKCI